MYIWLLFLLSCSGQRRVWNVGIWPWLSNQSTKMSSLLQRLFTINRYNLFLSSHIIFLSDINFIACLHCAYRSYPATLLIPFEPSQRLAQATSCLNQTLWIVWVVDNENCTDHGKLPWILNTRLIMCRKRLNFMCEGK